MRWEALTPDVDGRDFLSEPGVCTFVYSTEAGCSFLNASSVSRIPTRVLCLTTLNKLVCS